MKNRITSMGLALAGAAAFAGGARASTISQKLGSYSDNDGLTRQRLGVASTFDGKPGETLTASSISLSVLRDEYTSSRAALDEYLRKIYGTGYRLNRQATVSASQTWDRVTETRALASYSTDDVVKARTWSVGTSEWYRHETVRVAIDISRTVVDQPVYDILDFDSRAIGNPTVTSATGQTISVRHLATPTTVFDYAAAWLEATNRPATKTGSVAVRQFIAPLNGALHASGARALNRGYVDTNSTFGQVDAWQGETAWVQNLWSGALAKADYRYYREDETTRAYQDEKVFGSDTVTIGLSQEFKVGRGTPVVVDAALGRYATNVGVKARTFEAGLTAKF